MAQVLAAFTKRLESWRDSIGDPHRHQMRVLQNLVAEYSKTEYGEKLGSADIHTIEEYRSRFPVSSYDSLKPCLQEVQRGNYKVLLPEEPINWVMTRGSTGAPKILPITRRHLCEILECGSRALLNFALRSNDAFMLEGRVLNLNFPSNVSELDLPKGRLIFGYSSGTYARLNPALQGLGLVPRQEEIDALKTDLTAKGWESRFEFIYHEAKDKNVVSIIGVAPVQTSFARYVKKRHGVYPKDLWRLKAIFSTSVPKIQTRYSDALRAFYGEAPVVEMYTATEGAFAQQKDDLPYVVPNFDTYLFEVITKRETKMLHEMKRGEWGRIIVSTSMLPRYDIGDLVEAMGKNYFRVFGRANRGIILQHLLYRLVFGWLL